MSLSWGGSIENAWRWWGQAWGQWGGSQRNLVTARYVSMETQFFFVYLFVPIKRGMIRCSKFAHPTGMRFIARANKWEALLLICIVGGTRREEDEWYTLSPIMGVQVGLLEWTVVAPLPRTREFSKKYVSITIGDSENHRTNLAFSSCFFIWRDRSELRPTTWPQMLQVKCWTWTFFCHGITTIGNIFN